MRGEPKHGLNSPAANPPPRSRLKNLVDRLEADRVRTTGAVFVPGKMSGWMQDPSFARAVVEKAIRRDGGPLPPFEPWLEDLVKHKMLTLMRVALEHPEAIDGKRKPGRPPPRGFGKEMILGAFFRAVSQEPSKTWNAHFEAAARYLGPGVTRHHVRAVAKPFLKRLAQAKHVQIGEHNMFDVHMRAVTTLIEILDKFDQQDGREPFPDRLAG
jgi:hypothetical protein